MACWCAGRCPHVVKAIELIQASKLHQADLALRRVLVENPGCGEAHKAIAYVMNETNRGGFAIPHILEAERILGPHPKVLLDKANVYRNAVKLAPAIQSAREAMAADPSNPLAWAMLANNLQADGRLDEMDAVLNDARARFGNHRQLRRMYAVGFGERKDWQAAVDVFASGGELDALDLFERGRALEKLARYSEAWADWMRAKEIQRSRGMVWNREQSARRYGLLADLARPRHFKRIPAAAPPPGPAPIFITGLPRSGTTMIEAALSAHPKIAGGDELMMMPDLISSLGGILHIRAPYPLSLYGLALAENEFAPDLLRDFYLRKARSKLNGEKKAFTWFTDKMPSNELHMPLIAKLFPQSPIIHTRRHPLDMVVSNMSHSLVHGGFISCSLESFAQNFVLVANLVDHFAAKIPGLNLVRIPYEEIVGAPARSIDALLPADLSPDPACYDFHLSEWRSRTISHRQVKEKIHARSVNRYAPFLDFLKPVLPELAPIIERQGYAI